jgi:lipoyl synthase
LNALSGMEKTNYIRKPEWLKIKLPKGENYTKLKKLVNDHHLNTICSSGNCPNLGECWNLGTATFMILGDICTRSCKFCNVKTGKPRPLDLDEPKRIAESVKIMNLKHCVITSVDRDDLSDGGAKIWHETILGIKKLIPQITIEALIPDFNAIINDISKVIQAGPDILSHNLETVRRLNPIVRSKAQYDRSIKVIELISQAGITSKSGIMVGIGETFEEVLETMDDLIKSGCKIFTIGQYLQPTREHLDVQEYIKPEIFEEYKRIGIQKGFRFVESGPLVRSSYHAEKQMN